MDQIEGKQKRFYNINIARARRTIFYWNFWFCYRKLKWTKKKCWNYLCKLLNFIKQQLWVNLTYTNTHSNKNFCQYCMFKRMFLVLDFRIFQLKFFSNSNFKNINFLCIITGYFYFIFVFLLVFFLHFIP